MNPNFPNPHADPNSSSLAYLNHLPPGTQPHYQAFPVVNPPQLVNRPAPDRAERNPQRDLMDIDTGDETSSPARNNSPENERGRGRKRVRPDTGEAEILEHSEPVCKQRRTSSPQPAQEAIAAPAIALSPEAMKNALLQVATEGHLDKLQSLMNQTGNLENDLMGLGLLKIAVEHGHIDIVKWLVEQGHDIHYTNEHSDNLFIIAASNGHSDVLKYLFEIGCNIEQKYEDVNYALIGATQNGHLEILKYLIAQGCGNEEISVQGNNLLMIAARYGHVDIVKYFAERRSNLDQENNFGDTALMMAVVNGHFEISKYLIEKGSKFRRFNKSGDNALMLAAQEGHLEILKYLRKKGADLHVINEDGKSALTQAARFGHLEVLKYLAEKDGDFQQTTGKGDNALTLAAKGGHLEVMKWLAERGCSIYTANDRGETALTRAAAGGHLNVVKWLVDQGHDVHWLTHEENNALILAAWAGSLELVQYLAEIGCDINHENDDGRTAFTIAMRDKLIDIACDLIKRGASVNIGIPPDSDGFLFEALDIGHTELINLLIPLHDLSKRSRTGHTPLMVAAQKNLIEVVRPMIETCLILPQVTALIVEAYTTAAGRLLKELLNNPCIGSNYPPRHSQLQSDGNVIIASAVIRDHVHSHNGDLLGLKASLGFGGYITLMQIKSARVGILAELPAWKIQHPDESIIDEAPPPSVLSLQEKLNTFISEDIEVLATQALQWEEDHLIPIVENLYECCLSHSLSQQPAIGIINELTVKGLYHPIAQRIATAWTSVWAAVSEEVSPIMQDATATHHFVQTPVGSTLLQKLRTALRHQFDSIEGRILRLQNVNLSERAKDLYADLVGRQLHLIAQFWRAES